MRLADVATLDAANQFLEGYLQICNQRFTVQPAQVADLHRPRPAHRELDRILCLKTTTACARISLLRIREDSIRIMRRSEPPRVLGEEHGDGTMRITHQGRPLDFHAITSRPMKTAEAKTVYQPRRPVTLRSDHPWRQRLRPEQRTGATVARL